MILNLSCLNGRYDLDIRYRGNKILNAHAIFGYCERDILEHIKGNSPLKSLPFIERIDPSSSQHYSVCFCMAIEKALDTKDNTKLDHIRMILLEMERIYAHICYIHEMTKFFDNIVLHNMSSRMKDIMLDTLEEISGRRMYSTIHFFGGINFNLSPGNVKQIEKTCEEIKAELKEFYELFFGNTSITSILYEQACLGRKASSRMTGPFSWNNGDKNDQRIVNPYLRYSEIEIKNILDSKPVASSNCIYSRIISIIKDTRNSLEIINTIINKEDITYSNKDLLKDSFEVTPGTYSSNIETPRGSLDMDITLDQKGLISKINIKNPTEINKPAVNDALNGCKIENARLAFESLDLSPMEADR